MSELKSRVLVDDYAGKQRRTQETPGQDGGGNGESAPADGTVTGDAAGGNQQLPGKTDDSASADGTVTGRWVEINNYQVKRGLGFGRWNSYWAVGGNQQR